MKIEDMVTIGGIYEFDCEFFLNNRRRTEMIGGVVHSIENEGKDTFIILEDSRAVNVKSVTRVIGPYNQDGEKL